MAHAIRRRCGSNPRFGKRSSEERLNAMGQEGWELVQAVTASHPDSSAWAGLTNALHYIFKRPVS
ncbi:DUF4177 domain-containing protein [Povalibacter sp.]|uniref:DUF4177 domain-containing protein n=1 Tax=Povalibacter sp. TaxID=1962978 RepID=UPI003FA6B687